MSVRNQVDGRKKISHMNKPIEGLGYNFKVRPYENIYKIVDGLSSFSSISIT